MRLRTNMLTDSLEILASKGWNLTMKSDSLHVTQDTLTTPNASGLLKANAEICDDIFGRAKPWWTIRQVTRLNVLQRAVVMWSDFWQRDEFDLPTDQMVQAGIKRHLIDIHRSISKRLDEELDVFHQA
jgi:hypothetical protein